jgi:hypothetical protein
VQRRAFLCLTLLAVLPSAARAGLQQTAPPSGTPPPQRVQGAAKLEMQLALIESHLKLTPFQRHELRRIVAWEIDGKLLDQGLHRGLSPRAMNQILGLLRPEQRKLFVELLGSRAAELLEQARRRRQVKSPAGEMKALPLDAAPLGGGSPLPAGAGRRGRRR